MSAAASLALPVETRIARWCGELGGLVAVGMQDGSASSTFVTSAVIGSCSSAIDGMSVFYMLVVSFQIKKRSFVLFEELSRMGVKERTWSWVKLHSFGFEISSLSWSWESSPVYSSKKAFVVLADGVSIKTMAEKASQCWRGVGSAPTS